SFFTDILESSILACLLFSFSFSGLRCCSFSILIIIFDFSGSAPIGLWCYFLNYPVEICSVFDLPHVVEGLEGGSNLKYIGGDMFKSVPSAHAIC
uniref:O-methyltransferase C-terminal domain-containing protein n=1 Tax=Solanum lycopersicum TaxID=4081 RepID=A0A3Q7FGI7_SOLLC